MASQHAMGSSYPRPDDDALHDWTEPRRIVVERLIGEWQDEARRDRRGDRGEGAPRRSPVAHAAALVDAARRRMPRLARRPARTPALPGACPACDNPAGVRPA